MTSSTHLTSQPSCPSVRGSVVVRPLNSIHTSALSVTDTALVLVVVVVVVVVVLAVAGATPHLSLARLWNGGV